MKLFAALRIPALAAIFFASVTSSSAQTSAIDPRSPEGAPYGHLPMSFETNLGQTGPSIQFLSHGQGYTLFLRPDEAVLVLQGAGSTAPANPHGQAANQVDELSAAQVYMQLVGANPRANVAHEDRQITRTNYFLGNDPSKWLTDIPNYGRIRYRSVYDGIDLVYYGNQRSLEHDFEVGPGADPAKIVLGFHGAKTARVDPATGDLILTIGSGARHANLRLLKPVTYQESNGSRIEIPSSYKLLPHRQVSFNIGRYDRSRPLIVDPVLVYSTYLGGSGANGHGDQGNGIAVDASGNAYIVGTTYSTNFPLSATPYQSQNNSALAGHGSTVFVSKFNPAGTALLYSTYLGGSGGDEGYAIALDSSGNAYVTGTTYSQDFPVTCGVLQNVSFSFANAAPTTFVSKLNPSGSALVYSTYLGGTGNDSTPSQGDVAQTVAVDSAGNAYVAGYTFSADFPVTTGAFQTHFTAGPTTSNAFLTKLNPTATALVYSTFLGGSGSNGAGDYANSIAIDASGDAYIAGSTASANFPVTSGAFQTTLKGSSNAFVAELNPTGKDALYSSYLGGSATDSAQAIAIDSNGFAYVAGSTYSSNFPTTSGALEGAAVAGSAYFANIVGSSAPTGFVSKLNQDGSDLEYSTYLEGPGTSAAGLSIDSAGDAYIAGTAAVGGAGMGAFGAFQTTPDALPTPTASSNAAFLIKLNPSATEFNYATLIGGSSNDSATALALDTAGNAYITGFANSTDFPTTTGAFQKTNGAAAQGASNAFASKFALAAEANTITYPAPPSIPISNSMTLVSQQFSWIDDSMCDEYLITVNVNLNTGATNPPPGGSISFFGPWEDEYFYPVQGAWGGTTLLSLTGAQVVSGGISGYWQAVYSGDSEYAPSMLSGDATPTQCTPAQTASAKSVRPVRQSAGRLSLAPNAAPTASTPIKPAASEPKFIPAPATGTGDRNAAASPSASPSCSLPTLTVTVNSATRLYGAANPVFTYTVNGLINGETVTVTTQTTATKTSPVGAYLATAVVGGAALVNYNLVVKDATLTITPAPLTVTMRSASVVYGTGLPNFQYKIAGLLNGDTLTVTPSTTATATAAVGTYPLTATLSGAKLPDYAPTLQNATLTVTPKTLLVYANVYRYTYGQTPSWPMTHGFLGFAYSDTASVVAGAPLLTSPVPLSSTTPAGKYTIQVAVGTLSAANYTIVTSQPPEPPGFVQVLPAALRVSVVPFLTSRVYGAANPTYTNTVTGLLNGDTVTVTDQPSSPTTPVGTYPITVTLSGPKSANYTAGVSNGAKLTITPIPLTVTVLPKTAERAYGAANPTFTYTAVGLVSGDILTPSTTATATSPVGSYPVTVTGPALTNYTLTLHGATLLVAKAPLYISAKNVAVTYGQTPPSITAYTLSGFLNGDTASVVSGAPVLTTTVTSTTPAGVYKIGVQVGTLTAANYDFDNFSSGEGSVEVYKAPLTILPASFTIHAGDPLPTFTYSIAGFVNGGTQATATTGAPTLTTTAPNNTTPGRYYIVANAGTLTAQNYYFNNPTPATDGTLTILAN